MKANLKSKICCPKIRDHFNITLPRKSLNLLVLFLIISFPIKAVSFVFMIFYFVVLLLKKKFNSFFLMGVCFVIIANLISNLLVYNTFQFLKNSLLFWMFLSPIIFLIVTNNQSVSKRYSCKDIKLAIEYYLIIQVFFSLVNISYGLLTNRHSFDLAFGDIISGTFRLPFMFKPDASNVIFAFTMIIVLFIYIAYFEKKSKFIIFSSLLVIFFASVNHLILAVLLSGFLTFFRKKIITSFLIFLLFVCLYYIFQPKNFNSIISRIILIFKSFKNFELLAHYSLKAKYFLNFIHDFKQHLIPFLFLGVGAGTYSSRAALFFSGEYVKYFHWKSISPYFANNTYILWKKLIERPPWLAGSFNYPYSSVTSFIAELGLLGSLLMVYFFFRKLKELKIFTTQQLSFFLLFLFIAGLVDNYYEYFQPWFVFYLIVSRLPPKYNSSRR